MFLCSQWTVRDPWLSALLHDAWMRLSPLCDKWEFTYLTTLTTGSFWPSHRQFQHWTRPSSSATYIAWGSGSTLPRAYCHPASEFCSWAQLSTQCSYRLMARVMGPACVAARQKPFVLPEHVLNTMAEARAPSTRCLYALKWSNFPACCQDRDSVSGCVSGSSISAGDAG